MLNDKMNKLIGLAVWNKRSLWGDCYLKLIREGVEPYMLLEREGINATEEELLRALRSSDLLNWSQRFLDRCHKRGIDIVTIGQKPYPTKLANIFKPPLVLFFKGAINAFRYTENSLAIVGSRKADRIGCDIAFEMAQYVARSGIAVVSGLAYGVDAAAHQGALSGEGGSITLAVLGNGLDTIYPSRHKKLSQEILDKGGLLVSQFEPEARPYKSNFLDRNRVIAGIAQATLVIQAPLRSGSLATARYALEEGRDVLAVPGCIRDPRYEGSNKLIKQGAHLISELSDIGDFFPVINNTALNTNKNRCKLNKDSIVINLLKSARTLHYDDLCQHFKDRGSLDKELLELEFSGSITRHPGNIVSLRIESP